MNVHAVWQVFDLDLPYSARQMQANLRVDDIKEPETPQEAL
jgi:hypothetical protein